MATERETANLTPRSASYDPLALFRAMQADIDRMFGGSFWSPRWRWPGFPAEVPERLAWSPKIEVFERGNRLITKVELPGVKKEDVKVEVADGTLTISGERKREAEEKKENMYRCEREYGSFYRAVPLPEGVRLEEVHATFAEGVLEVSIPLLGRPEAKVRTVEIAEPPKAAKSAA